MPPGRRKEIDVKTEKRDVATGFAVEKETNIADVRRWTRFDGTRRRRRLLLSRFDASDVFGTR